MNFEFLTVLAGVLASLVVGLLTALVAYAKRRRLIKRAPTLEDTIVTLARSLEDASATISEIENEIAKRREITEKLREDTQRYQQLRELSQPQVEAIAQAIRGEVAASARRSIYINAVIAFGIALVFFLGGFFIGRI
jgi:biopolymer transport protein ExbB/TolQ